ncbi:MAG: ATP-dependent Clp protease ATP-binding subunit [Patescibacteria group bacterium]
MEDTTLGIQELIEQSTTHLHRVLVQAAQIAAAQGKRKIEPSHLFFGITNEAEIFITHLVLRNTDLPAVHLPKSRIDLSIKSRKILESAATLAYNFHHTLVDIPHLFMSLLSSKDEHIQSILKEYQIDPQRVYTHLESLLKNSATIGDLLDYFMPQAESPSTAQQENSQHNHDTQQPAKARRITALEYFSIQLTDKHQAALIDPVIGREREIDRLMRILARRTKNNPILVGAPGVGKTAIVEGLAKRIAEGNVPSVFRSKKICSLNLTSLVAGSAFRGELEMRFKQLLDDVKQDENVILFIDEIHNLVGAGSSNGALDAANILKPALARGELRCIGATTPQEYKKYIEEDPALERRFQPILIEQPSLEESIAIINGLVPHYEQYHRVSVAPEAVRASVHLSDRYITDKNLPDKALDLIDEAAAKIKIESTRYPLIQSLEQAEFQAGELVKQREAYYAQNELVRANFVQIQEAEVQMVIQTLQKQLEGHDTRTIGRITPEQIADIISSTTGIPISSLIRSEREELLNLEDLLSEKIIGQLEAKRLIANSLRRAKAGLRQSGRPIASFLFLGPSGVGKTELAKELSRLMFGKQGLVKLDMSEFSESFTISRLIGAPSGYIGYKEGGRLTESVKAHPHSLVLFDEIEKAHPRILNILLQILEDGCLTDAAGKKVDFSNTLIILTSNIGAKLFSEDKRLGFASSREKTYSAPHDAIQKELKECLSPELLSRLTHTVVFDPLKNEDLLQIAQLHMSSINTRLNEQGVVVTWTPKTCQHIISCAQQQESQGARHLRTIIEQEVEHAIAELLLRNPDKRGTILCDVRKSALYTKWK